MRLVLASSSKNRRDIFDMIGLKYDVITSLVDEESDKTNVFEYVTELSKNKAYSVKDQIDENAIIISADSVIYMNDKIYEKPKTKEEAFNNFKEMSGNVTKAVTCVTILDLYQNKEISFTDSVDVKFNCVTDEEIKWYVDNEINILNKCGYAILGKASLFLDRVDGDYNTLFGISPSKLYGKLKELGYKLSDFELK